jgi:uncharacterized protein involved in outer membrane biogenesis
MDRSRSRKSLVLRRIALWTGLSAAALVLSGAVFVLIFDWNWLKSGVTQRVADASHRDFAIEGDIEGEWRLTPRIAATGIRIGNAPWAGTSDMLRIERLEFRIDLVQLIKGSVVLPEVKIVGAEIDLQKNAEGMANWDFSPISEAGAVAEATIPDERNEFPIIGRLTVERSRLRYSDAAKGTALDAKVSQAEGESDAAKETVSLSGEGKFEGMPFRLDVRGGSVLRLQDETVPYPLHIEAAIGDTRVAFDGTLTDPLHPDVFDIALKMSGASLSDLFPIFGVPLPPTPPYSLEGRLKHDGVLWTVAGLNGRVGDSDLSGDLTIDTGRDPPFMRATLLSRVLDFDDLAGFIGATPQAGAGETASARQKAAAREKEADPRVLPNVPIDLSRLRAMNMAVDYTGRRIKAPKLPLENLKAALRLENGVLTLKPIEFGVADGTIGGVLILDGRKDMPRMTSDLMLRRLSLKPFFAVTDMADLTAGRFGGRIRLTGNGRSLAEVLGASSGETTVAMTGGSLSPLLVELIGLDIAETLAIVIADSQTPVPIRCAFGQFKVEKGSMKTEGIVVDTADSTLLGTGAINLGSEKIAMTIRADPKDVSPLSANAPIAITGTFHDPEISIDPTGTAGEGLFDRIVSLADPILALLPVMDLGTAKDRDCAALMRGDVKGSTQRETPSSPR